MRDSTVIFDDGIPGFESFREFVIVASATVEPFTILKGVGDDAPSFVAIDPRHVAPSYPTTLDAIARDRLRTTADEPLIWLSLVAIQPDGAATVNLRAPLVISPASMRGMQIVPADSVYRVDHPFATA